MNPVPGRTTGGPGFAHLGIQTPNMSDDWRGPPTPVAGGSVSPGDDVGGSVSPGDDVGGYAGGYVGGLEAGKSRDGACR
jgi:hypothetical protein